MKPKVRFRFLQTKRNTCFAILEKVDRKKHGKHLRYVIEIGKQRGFSVEKEY